jgi:hypothetical protein
MMRRILSSGSVVVACALAVPASAGLSGMSVQLNHVIDGSLLVPGGSFIPGPYTVVGAGIEWTTVADVWVLEDPNNPVYGGMATYDLDIGDDYVELTITADLLDLSAAGWAWEVFYQIPAAFNGLMMGFDTAIPAIDAAAISFSGAMPGGHVAAWDLWAVSNPALEAWVDSMSMSPTDVARVGVSSGNSLELNLQGIAWAYPAAGGVQSMTMRVDFTFVPAPGAFALLGLAGLATRRRRR